MSTNILHPKGDLPTNIPFSYNNNSSNHSRLSDYIMANSPISRLEHNKLASENKTLTKLYQINDVTFTASNMKSIVGRGSFIKRSIVRNVFGLEPDFKGNEATIRGSKLEYRAFLEYQDKYSDTAKHNTHTYFLDDSFSYIGATPDGIDVSMGKLIEIKSPTARTFNNPSFNPYDYMYQNYYYQVQTQMKVLDYDRLDFVIYYKSKSGNRMGKKISRSRIFCNCK